jgi:hypothetical protein
MHVYICIYNALSHMSSVTNSHLILFQYQIRSNKDEKRGGGVVNIYEKDTGDKLIQSVVISRYEKARVEERDDRYFNILLEDENMELSFYISNMKEKMSSWVMALHVREGP